MGFATACSLVFFVTTAAAQGQPATAPPAATPAAGDDATIATPAAASTPPDLEVVQLVLPPAPAGTPSEKRKEAARQAGRTAGLGDSIELRTSPDLGSYLNYAATQNKAVTLFLDGNDTGIAPEAIDPETGTLRFHLERDDDNKEVWSALLRDPFHYQQREVKASVGLGGGVAVRAKNSTFTLVVVNWAWYAFFWLLLMAGLLVVSGWLAARRDLLRDGPKPCPYSLGRCQMAWWFFLIAFGYVMIWLISGDQDTITPSLLTLMGISSATALGSVLIESTSSSVEPSQTRGFFRDILSDSTGTVGLHRFQIVVWTIVLGIIFLVSVVTELSMPTFSATLLAMMGISAGTYLGFKFPEK
jgi:hypothetical protein